MAKKVIVIGAGFTGLAAAYELSRAGHEVVLLESDGEIGGLAGTFELSPGVRIEKFYHHWFSSDTDVLGLFKELGVYELVQYCRTNTGIYHTNSIFRLASPLDLLTFTPIPFVDRVRTGLMALKARRIEDWMPLEDISAADWLIKVGGRRAYEAIWRPLLNGKFGVEADNISAVWFWNKLKLRGSSRGKGGGEELVYFKGGFGKAADLICAKLKSLNVDLRLRTKVERIVLNGGKVTGVAIDGELLLADIVLCTTPLPTFVEMTPELPKDYKDKCLEIRFLGNVCLVLRLKRSLSETYWLNVADPSFPFVGVIEHTNLDSKEHYQGEHIAYLSKYLPTSDPMFSMSDDEVLDYCLPFIQRIFPAFSRDWLIRAHTWRARYSQPVITKHYSQYIPQRETPISGLWLSTMAQVYPEDRGTNYAVRHGRACAREIIEKI